MKKARVLLLWPGTEGPAAGNFGVPQLVTMATYARQKTGARVDIVDLTAERALGRVALDRILAGPDGSGYDLVGFACYASFDFLKIDAIARLARDLLPDAVFAAGGYHASARPTDFVYDGSPFDVAVVGEGERPLVRLIESIHGGAPIRGEIMPSDPVADLDELPASDWTLLDRYKPVLHRVAGQIEVYLSRGCPFDCAFCMERAKREVSWRPLPVERALEEVERAHAYFDLSGRTVYFADALFGMRKKWRREFLEGLAARKIPASKFWLLVRVDMIDDEDLDLFGRANCALGFGLESGDPKHLATIRKAGRLEDYLDRMRAIARSARERDVPWGANIIVGHPGETEDTLRTTAAYMRELFLDPAGTTGFLSVDPFRLYPGSPIDDEREAWEQRFGTKFHRPTWWQDGDQEFLAEWVDPSADLDYLTRARLTHELLGPTLRGLERSFVYQGPARDYFLRAISEQVENLDSRYRLHFLGRYFAWHRYLGRSALGHATLEADEYVASVCREARERALGVVAQRVAPASAAREAWTASFLTSPLAEALRSVRRERFVPLDFVREASDDAPVALDDSGAATVSAMHAYVRSFTLARVGPGSRVLDLGGGTGYGAALLAALVGDAGVVVTVEVDPKLAARARALLPPSVHVVAGSALDAATLAEAAARAGGPFDAVTVGFALPCPLEETPLGSVLAPSAWVAAPTVKPSPDGDRQVLVAGHWTGAAFEVEEQEPVYYVQARSAADFTSAPAPAAITTTAPAGEPPKKRKLPVVKQA
ncbi:MAG: radical SAM protein [Polyangiaceae bacterium]